VLARPLFIVITAASLAGCATPGAGGKNAAPLTAEGAAAELDARSLAQEGLIRFLTENLERPPGPVATWDFETLSWVAFYYHPSLGVARAQWAVARAAQASAGLRPNPTLTLTPGYNFTREAGVSPWFPGINLDFLLPNSAKRAHQQDMARAEAEGARLAVLASAWQVRSELRRALTDGFLAGRRAETLQAQADLQARLTRLIEQRVEAGGAAATELSTVRAAWLRSTAAAADAQSQAAGARAKVAAALGVPVAALQGVTFPAPTKSLLGPEAIAQARTESLRSRADVLVALARYRAAQAALELEIAKQAPDFHLGPGYQWDQGGNKWSLALTLELPLFHRNEAAIAEAEARRTEAAAQFTAVQAQALAAIDAALAAQQAAARQRDVALQLQRELAEQERRTQQRFELGAVGQLELQTAQFDRASVDTLMIEAEAAAALAAGQLEDALQVPFPHLLSLADAKRVPVPMSP
jgi:outer membrane protein, heavy metal efflux system